MANTLPHGTTYREPPRTTTHRARRRPGAPVVGVLLVVAAIAVLLGYRSVAPSSSSSASSSTVAQPVDVPRSEGPGSPGDAGGAPTAAPPRERRGPLGEADGAVPDGTTVFDDEVPGVANLDPALLGALHEAATDAADAGIELQVTSGWRSPEYQEQLLSEAVAEYGSEEEAARWVATPDTSLHVSGDAVDIGPLIAMAWLSENGDDYGLCQVYGNEPWHYELRPQAIGHDCPPMYADPTEDPRMQP